MKKHLWMSAAIITLALGASPALAEGETTDNAPAATSSEGMIDAGSLVGKTLEDADGANVGEIDAVLVDDGGQVQSVIVDVSGWLQTEKMISLNWSDLRQGPDGEVITTMTKEDAQVVSAYAYPEGQKGGQVLNERGEPYTPGAMTTSAGTDASDEEDTLIRNADGSMNVSRIIGAKVESGTGDNLGEVHEVVVGKEGSINGVVVDVGGFLGMGEHSVLLDWKEMELVERDGDEIVMVQATKDSLKEMPEYQARR